MDSELKWLGEEDCLARTLYRWGFFLFYFLPFPPHYYYYSPELRMQCSGQNESADGPGPRLARNRSCYSLLTSCNVLWYAYFYLFPAPLVAKNFTAS